jgi:hypothetical protein
VNPRYAGIKRAFYCDAFECRITSNPFTYVGGPHGDELFVLCWELCMRVHKTACNRLAAD